MSRFYPMYAGDYPEDTVDALCKELGVSPLCARALMRRGLRDPKEAYGFLYPNASQFHDPYLLPDMAAAVARIRQGIQAGEKLCVFGDYDADGICATTILLNCLTSLGANCVAYIPSRHREGYGLREYSVRKLAEEGVKLIITVDNGINAFYEVKLARDLGMEVIVTDHHSAEETIPACAAVVAASRRDSTYPNPELCGAGVAYQLAAALRPEGDRANALALAAVATVADVVPLTGENRAMVSMGIDELGRNLGLRKLLEAAGWKGQPVTSHTLAFLIAPRLNASGRIGSAMRGVELLRSQNPDVAKALASQLDNDNTARKECEGAILTEATEQADLTKRAILVRSQGWNPGVIGIVASRLSETYHRPAILFAEHDGVLTGSGRSPEGIDLYELLCRFTALYQRFGGHARAAGITMPPENFDAFLEGMYAALDAFDPACFEPAYCYEESIRLSDLSVPAVNELELLAPFGEGNPEPVFLFENVRFRNVGRMGTGGTHLSCMAVQEEQTRRLVAFRMGAQYDAMARDNVFDLTAKPTVNRFRNREDVELNLQAFANSGLLPKLFDAIFENFMYNGSCTDAKLAEWYLYIKQYLSPVFTKAYMAEQYVFWRDKLADGSVRLDAVLEEGTPNALFALLVFTELSFVLIDGETGMLRMNPELQTRPLSDSRLYQLSLNGTQVC